MGVELLAELLGFEGVLRFHNGETTSLQVKKSPEREQGASHRAQKFLEWCNKLLTEFSSPKPPGVATLPAQLRSPALVNDQSSRETSL